MLVALLLSLHTSAALAESSIPPIVRLQLFPAALDIDDGFAPLADVCGLVIVNPHSFDINAIELNLTPEKLGVAEVLVTDVGFYNPADLDAAGGALPSFRGFPITDSFVVLLEGLSPLAAVAVFESDRIETTYTVANSI